MSSNKTILQSIISNNKFDDLKSYIQKNNDVDYLFSKKLGDNSYSLNSLYYAMIVSSPEFVQTFLENVNPLFITDNLSYSNKNFPYENILNNFLSKNYNHPVFNKLWPHLKQLEKEKFIKQFVFAHIEKDENYLLNNPFINESTSFSIQYLIFEKIIKKDDFVALDKLLNTFKNFIPEVIKFNSPVLIDCLKTNSVLCFDLLKDSIKPFKIKSLENNNHLIKKNKI